MSRKKTNPSSSASNPAVRIAAINLIVAAFVLGVAGWGYHRLYNHVEHNLAQPAKPPVVVLRTQPAWMNDTLAEHITRSVIIRGIPSAMDHRVLEQVAQTLSANPWVRKVKQVRRTYNHSVGDTIELDCDFRAPMALVAHKNEYILIDGEGVKLPERFPVSGGNPPILFSSDGRVNIRIIEGVAAAAPSRDGQKWPGADLQAGLDLAKFLYNQPAADDIFRINVANFANRHSRADPQLVLITRNKSEIRWGEPIKMSFYAEVSPARKLERLARLVNQFGRADAGLAWIDIRNDKILYPTEQASLIQLSDVR